MPGFQARPAAALSVVRHLRLFVQFPSDAVADKFPHDTEMMAHRFIFDRRAKIAEPGACMRVADRALAARFRSPRSKLLDALVDHADGNGRRGIAHPAVLHHADVELHDVAVLDPALTADAVHDLVI